MYTHHFGLSSFFCDFSGFVIVALDAMHLMTMGFDMGAAAISAAQARYSQLDAAFESAGRPKTGAQP